MKPWTTWLARLGIAGACFLVTGCGGSDIPDASDDGQASSESAPNAGAGGGAPAAVEGPKVAQAEPAPGAEEAPAATPAPSRATEPEAPADAPTSAEGQGKSSTAEMLALATGPTAGSNASAADAATPSPNASATPGAPGPGAMAGGGMMARGMMGGGMQPPPGMGRGSMTPADMAKMSGMNPNGMAGMPGAGSPAGPGGPGGMRGPGGMGGAGGAGRDDGPADFHSPQGAVKAFLAALKAKDLDRLNESTALRAQVEAASSKSQELFKKIFDLNLSESELDELAEKLNGYTIFTENPPKSTGRVEVILRKTGKNNAYALRKVTVRHEKKGWGVLDVAGEMEFKSIGATRRNTGTGGGGRR